MNLTQYILENVFEGLENNSIYLMKTADEAKQFFHRQVKNKDTLQDLADISDEEIDAVYKYAQENNLPAPMVGCYQNSQFGFAFRRWFTPTIQAKLIVNDSGDIFSFNEDCKYFKGYHNTAMKESGIFVPNAQDYEQLISFAYNNYYDIFKNDKDNANACDINANKAENLINYYYKNQESFDIIAQRLHDVCPSTKGFGKLKTKGQQVSSDWADTFKNTKPNSTPKTDVCSLDGKYKISLKENGGSQLMSAKIDEALATLLFGVEYNFLSDTEKTEVLAVLKTLVNDDNRDDLFKEFGPDDLKGKTLTQMQNDDPKFKQLVEDAKKKGKGFEANLNKLLKSYPNYKKGFFVEAMTGNHKFVKNSLSAANYVFVWNEVNPQLSKVYTIDEYYNHIKDDSKVTVDFKSWPTSKRSGQTLKIITK